ncbi:hypothetical protein ACFE04_011098 [Oxalis oulophora]
MVRVRVPKSNTFFFPPKPNTNDNSNFLSKKQQCLTLLRLCSSPKHVTQIHAQIHVSGLHNDTLLITELIRFCCLFSRFKNLDYAKTLLDKALHTAPFSWNMIIRGYASSDSPKKAIQVFRQMKNRGVCPNQYTFPFLFKACAEFSGLREGRQVHVDCLKCGLDNDLYVTNNLVHFYGSCNKIMLACSVFDEMPERSLVSWNAVITACVDNLKLVDAIGYFVKMRDFGFEPDETTMVVVLSACTVLGNLSLGKWVHSQVIEKGLILNSQLGTSLVDMYGKCGSVDYAKLVFNIMEEKNVWTWSAMILGLAQQGYAEEALKVFSEMNKNSSIRPNYVTFLGVLSACSHSGLVKDGYRYFHDMEKIYKIRPVMLHYGAMVDILGRAGFLKEAYNFIVNMPIVPDPVIWRTLLSACIVHHTNDKDGVGNKVKKMLLELEPRRGGNFVMVANMYAEDGMWEKAARIRTVMRTGGLKKMAGESWVELGGNIFKFVPGYDPKVEYEQVYRLLEGLYLHMKMVNFS